jgi:tetratricopeptide (TPR) repeat protein
MTDPIDDTLLAPGAARADYPDLVTVTPDHYENLEEIARGGMGRIRAARDRRLGRRIAIKEVLTARGDLAVRFEREARITARLEHPSIVSVHEAGRWPSGEPFFAMKLVSGRSLDDVIAAGSTLAARLALLPSVLAVADAIAYAHDQRIVHRDLKPKNVLVGRFGETVVVDWGLAKDLDRDEPGGAAPGADPAASMPGADVDTLLGATPAPPDTAGASLTVAGSVMGTPAYMPPEQARGEPVDERADVYAIGAILYHLLAGRPPVTGVSSVDVLEQVMARRTRPVTDVQPDAPAELVAIVAKAMAFEPSDRYPGAGALAADLRRFQTGQLVGAHRYSLGALLRRWIARHRAAVAVGAVAVVVVAALAVIGVRRIMDERRRAEDQRALADQSRGDAEALVDFMLFELGDKLSPIGRLDLLDTVTQRAAGYYEARADHGSSREQAKRATTRVMLGDLLQTHGDLDGSLREYRAAIAIREALAAAEPHEPAWQRELAAGHRRASDILRAQGDGPGAIAEARTALAIAVRLTAANPDDATAHGEVAASHVKVGDTLHRQRDLAGALIEYRAALAIRERFAGGGPEQEREVAMSHNRVAGVLAAQGDVAGSLAAYRAALAISERLASSRPTHVAWQRDRTVSHNRIGDLLLAEDDLAGARAEYEAALAIAERLHAADPGSVDRQRDLSISYGNIGFVLRAQGDAAGALAAYRAELAIAQRLAAHDPRNTAWQRDLSVSHEQVGAVLLELADADAALAEYRAGLAIAQRLAAHDPTNAGWQRDLSISHVRLGDLLRARGDVSAALVEYRADLAIAEQLVARDPDNRAWQRDLALSHDNVAAALEARGDAAGARAARDRAARIRAELSRSEASPSSPRRSPGRTARPTGR